MGKGNGGRPAPPNGADLLARLGRVITPLQPFGPPDAAQYASSVDLLRLLYDKDNRIHRQAENTGAPYVIGRKGAGKTAFVTAPRMRDDVIAVELPSADVYQGVFGVLRSVAGKGIPVFPEHSARLWRHLTWCAVLSAIAHHAPSAAKRNGAGARVVEFVEALGGGKAPSSAESAVSAYLTRLTNVVSRTDNIAGFGELLNSITADGWAITEAIEAGIDVLRSTTDKRYVVIVDSLERYQGVLPTMDHQVVERNAFEGLFRFIGGDGTMPERSFDIRFAFPAELWSTLESISSNPIKDFHQRIIAQWSARELVQLVGARLSLYCQLNDSERIPTAATALTSRGLMLSYDESRELIGIMLSSTVKNGMNTTEDVIAYLMRHTQLLPRHLITILNRIWEAQISIDSNHGFPISAVAVVDGVRRGEIEVVGDILAAYTQVHPFAKLCCERVIPNLGMVFGEGELHKAYNRNGIKSETGMEFHSFVRQLVEVGAIGRVMESESTQRYVIGEFEYIRPGSLYIASDETFCLHPVFAEVFNCRHSSSRQRQLSADERALVRPVYPFGSDPNSPHDYRDEY